MAEKVPHEVHISIDLKKYRIRLHKYFLHLLGDPAYIQLLINPVQKVVAIKAVENPNKNSQAHAISKAALESKNSVEIYSRTFVLKLIAEINPVPNGHTYRMNGTIVSSEGMAIFDMKTLTEVDEEDKL